MLLALHSVQFLIYYATQLQTYYFSIFDLKLYMWTQYMYVRNPPPLVSFYLTIIKITDFIDFLSRTQYNV